MENLVGHITLVIEEADGRCRRAEYLGLGIQLQQTVNGSTPLLSTRAMKLVKTYQVIVRMRVLRQVQRLVGHVLHAAFAPLQHAMHLVEHKRVRAKYQHLLEILADGGNQIAFTCTRRMHHAGVVGGLKSPHHLLIGRLVV